MLRFVLNCEFCIIHLILIHILSYAVMTINVTLPVLINLHWLPIDHRILYKILLNVFKCLNNLAPGYLTELVIPYNPARALRSETANLLTKISSYPFYRFLKFLHRYWKYLESKHEHVIFMIQCIYFNNTYLLNQYQLLKTFFLFYSLL